MSIAGRWTAFRPTGSFSAASSGKPSRRIGLTREQTYELQCLGVVLGDAFAQELGLRRVAAEDDAGRDPALPLPGTSVLLFLRTTISERAERGEDVDVFALFNGVAAQIDGLRDRGTA